MKYRSITISGPIASGTTTAAKGVSEKLGLEYHSAGDFFRKYALEHNLPLYEHVPDKLDLAMDKKLQEEVKKGIVLDSHYAGYFNRANKNVLKVLLLCDEKERIRRALARTHTHQESEGEIKKREKAHDAKFRKLYTDENYLDPKFFDLVIDTTNTTIEETTNRITNRFLGR